MIVYVLEFNNQRIEFPTLEGPEGANQYKLDNNIDAVPFEFEKVIVTDELTLEQKYQLYREKIGIQVEKLNRSALRRAVGKDDSKYDFMTDKQLNDLRNDTYPRKKALAETFLTTGNITNQKLFNSMYNVECEVDFAGEKLNQTIAYLNTIEGVNIPTEGLTRMQLFCHIVLVKFTLGSTLFEELTTLIEVFRITSLTRLDNLQFDKLDAGFLLIQDLHLITDLEDFYNLQTEFEAL